MVRQHVRSTIAVAILIAFLTNFSEEGVVPKTCYGQADILFIIDSSGSISSLQYQLQLNFTAAVVSSFDVGPNKTQFAALIFSTSVDNVFGFGSYRTKQEIQQAILNLTHIRGYTYTGAALNSARTFSFTPANGARQNVTNIAIIITDGQSSDGADTTTEAFLLKRSNVTVICVGVGSNVDNEELRRIASDPSLIFLVDDFSLLGAITSLLSATVCEEQTTPTNTLLCIGDNGCVGKVNGNYPACDPECQKGYYYSCSNEYTYTMPCGLGWYEAANGTRFTARMVYNKVTDSCELKADYCPRDPEKYAVPQQAPNGGSQTHQSRPVLNYGSSCVGRRNGNYPKSYPECQDGFYFSCSNNETHEMPCSLGVYIGTDGQPYQNRMVYDAASDSCQLITSSCPRNQNDPPTGPTATVTSPGTPQCKGKADVVIVLDSSGSIGKQNYDVITFFVADLTSFFDVGPDDVQFSAIIFGSIAINLFNFSDYKNNSGVRQALLNAPYLNSGTDTAEALKMARTNSFSPLNGARLDVGRVVIVLTDGLSNDPNATIKEAERLKRSNVTVMAVGVGPGTMKNELLAIASFPRLTFEVDNFQVLSAIRRELVTSACESGGGNAAVGDSEACIRESCVGKQNGNYPACSPECQEGHYYTCSNEYTYKMTCGSAIYAYTNGTSFTAKMVYNKAKNYCELEVNDCPRDSQNNAEVSPPHSNPPPSCVTGDCGNIPNGVYEACSPLCKKGYYYVCQDGQTFERTCGNRTYTDTSGSSFEARGVYDSTSQSCQATSKSCPRNTEDCYK